MVGIMKKINLKLESSFKSRVAHIFQYENFCLYLLVHPCGELLICIDTPAYASGSRWDAACIHYIDTENAYYMCKYGSKERKFILPGANENLCQLIAESCGIAVYGEQGMNSFPWETSTMAKGFLTWSAKHPRMASQFTSILQTIQNSGLTAFSDSEYSGG